MAMKAVRFNFDTAFDGTITESARKAAENLEATKAEAFEAGRQQGRAEAEAGINSRTSAVLASLLDATNQIFGRLDESVQANLKQASQMSLLIAQRLAPRLVAERPSAEIEGLIRDCLELCLQEPRLVVRVAEELVDPMKEQLDDLQRHAGYAGKFVLIGDPDIAIGDCRVEWPDGGAERCLADLEEEITRAVERFVGEAPNARTAAPAEATENASTEPLQAEPAPAGQEETTNV